MNNPALIERLTAIAHHADTLGHGVKTHYLKQQAQGLGWSMDKLYRHLKKVAIQPQRKRRADAGTSTLTLEEAKLISAAVLEGARKNGKRIMTIGRATEMLRANGLIDAVQIDEDGVCTPLSESTITRALKDYGLHPEQLLQPDPVTRMKSLHPNHWWQIDPSMCVLYYLPRHGKDTGLRIADAAAFYKNKPANLVKVLNDRVWRYTGTDHASGTICVRYYFGGETSQNLCDFFIFMMQPKANVHTDPIRGVPTGVMLDPGSANTSHAFKNLCKQLGVRVQINTPHKPRAKGQVEKANDMVETAFESGLRFIEINNIDQLNALSLRWMQYFNGTEIHSRHKMTRYQAWNRIQAEQLILPPPADYCRELAVSAPKEVKVTPDLEIQFSGKRFSVRDIADVMVGQKLMVAKNPWRPDVAQVATYDAAGNEIWQTVEPVEFGDFGFRESAVVMGEEYRASVDTPAQQHKKELNKIAMMADTLEEAEAKRKTSALPFGGSIDPYKHQENTLAERNILYVEKQGQQLDYNRKEVTEQVLSKVEIAKLLKPRIDAEGGNWPQAVKTLQLMYPGGVVASEVESVFERLRTSGSLKLHKTGTAL
ncbi:transposase [Snodgrassella sp. CFCC 13594]|uniref:transposase n=1 Tax=Snodgrassella sp. CFCC 13594 TaxID=1775559 RepID=UPI000B072D88|nr:transposase [Snodgrassella sp. CFCC 13594]